MTESTTSNDDPVDMKNEDVPDMSESSDDNLSAADHRQRANEIYERLAEGRGQSSMVYLETPYGEIPCDINLSNLDLQTRWDCISALPDGMFSAAASNADEPADIELSSDIVPDGEGMIMIRAIILNTLEPRGYSDGDWKAMVKNDLRDEVLIQVGMGILEMSFDRGEITGFRFE